MEGGDESPMSGEDFVWFVGGIFFGGVFPEVDFWFESDGDQVLASGVEVDFEEFIGCVEDFLEELVVFEAPDSDSLSSVEGGDNVEEGVEGGVDEGD